MERKRKLTSHPDMKDHLMCAICTDTFDDPRNLVCGHVFCRKCLDVLYRTVPGYQKISCPTCRKTTKIREKGVIGLSRNLPILGLLDQDLSEEPGPSSKRPKTTSACTEHRKEQRDIYCSICLVFVCFKCFKGNHNTHATKTRNEFLGELSQKTDDAKQKYQVQLKTLENNLLEADQKMHELVSNNNRIKEKINVCMLNFTTTEQKMESDVGRFKERGEQFKKSLAIAVPKLECKTLEDLDDEDLKSYVENVDIVMNVTNLLKADIGVEHLKLWNKRILQSAASIHQTSSVPSTSDGTAGQAPKRVSTKSVNKSL